MTENALKLMARRYMGLAPSEEVVSWALSELIAGIDSKSLCILAGLENPVSGSEVELLLQHTFDELGWQVPAKEDCLREYARLTAHGILSGMITPLNGCREMYQINMALHYPPELDAWLYLDDGLDPHTYESLSDQNLDAAIKRQALLLMTKSNQEL